MAVPVELVTFLAPLLPYLLKAGGAGLEELARRLGGETAELAGALWRRLAPGVAASRAGNAAIRRLADRPDDDASRQALAKQLAVLLAKDAHLRRDVERLWQSLGVTVAGDDNVVQAGRYNLSMRDGSNIHIGDVNR
jgi:hypothetical protein